MDTTLNSKLYFKKETLMTERTPSYSYTTPDKCSDEQKSKKKDDHWHRPKRSSKEIYQSCPDNINADLSKTPTGRDYRNDADNADNEGKLEYSRPSSREDFLTSSHEIINGLSRTSRSKNIYEKPHRRVVSPGAEVSHHK